MLDHVVIASAAFAFLASAIGMRLTRRVPATESRPSQGPIPTSPGADPAAVGSSPEGRTRVLPHLWGKQKHLVEFVAWMRAMGFVKRYAAAEIYEYYLWFAQDVNVEPLSSGVFLAGLADAGAALGVKKKRDRIKDPKTGRVLYLASGTPQRTRYYSFVAPRRAAVPDGEDAPCSASESRARPRSAAAFATGPDDVVAGHEIARRAA